MENTQQFIFNVQKTNKYGRKQQRQLYWTNEDGVGRFKIQKEGDTDPKYDFTANDLELIELLAESSDDPYANMACLTMATSLGRDERLLYFETARHYGLFCRLAKSMDVEVRFVESPSEMAWTLLRGIGSVALGMFKSKKQYFAKSIPKSNNPSLTQFEAMYINRYGYREPFLFTFMEHSLLIESQTANQPSSSRLELHINYGMLCSMLLLYNVDNILRLEFFKTIGLPVMEAFDMEFADSDTRALFVDTVLDRNSGVRVRDWPGRESKHVWVRFNVSKANRANITKRRVLLVNATLGVIYSFKRKHLLDDRIVMDSVPLLKVYELDRDQCKLERDLNDGSLLHISFRPKTPVTDYRFQTQAQRERFCATVNWSLLELCQESEIICGLRGRPTIGRRMFDEIPFNVMHLWHRDWPQVDASIYCLTYNVGGSVPSDMKTTCSLISDDALGKDIYVFAFQEVGNGSIRDKWVNALKKRVRLGGPYEELASVKLREMMLLCIVRTEHIPDITNIQTDMEATGLGIAKKVTNTQLGNKGGIGISFDWCDSSFCFVGSHLAARPERIDQRNQDFRQIVRKLRLGSYQQPLLHSFDYFFWMGDLNYRVELDFEDAVDRVQQGRCEELLEHDQLLKQQKKGASFVGFREGKILFPPTYRWMRGKSEFSNKRGQAPSYTDRILFRTSRAVEVEEYFSPQDSPEVQVSDHRPVFACFRLDIPLPLSLKPARQRASQILTPTVCSQQFDVPDSIRTVEPHIPRCVILLQGVRVHITDATTRFPLRVYLHLSSKALAHHQLSSCVSHDDSEKSQQNRLSSLQLENGDLSEHSSEKACVPLTGNGWSYSFSAQSLNPIFYDPMILRCLDLTIQVKGHFGERSQAINLGASSVPLDVPIDSVLGSLSRHVNRSSNRQQAIQNLRFSQANVSDEQLLSAGPSAFATDLLLHGSVVGSLEGEIVLRPSDAVYSLDGLDTADIHNNLQSTPLLRRPSTVPTSTSRGPRMLDSWDQQQSYDLQEDIGEGSEYDDEEDSDYDEIEEFTLLHEDHGWVHARMSYGKWREFYLVLDGLKLLLFNYYEENSKTVSQLHWDCEYDPSSGTEVLLNCDEVGSHPFQLKIGISGGEHLRIGLPTIDKMVKWDGLMRAAASNGDIDDENKEVVLLPIQRRRMSVLERPSNAAYCFDEAEDENEIDMIDEEVEEEESTEESVSEDDNPLPLSFGKKQTTEEEVRIKTTNEDDDEEEEEEEEKEEKENADANNHDKANSETVPVPVTPVTPAMLSLRDRLKRANSVAISQRNRTALATRVNIHKNNNNNSNSNTSSNKPMARSTSMRLNFSRNPKLPSKLEKENKDKDEDKNLDQTGNSEPKSTTSTLTKSKQNEDNQHNDSIPRNSDNNNNKNKNSEHEEVNKSSSEEKIVKSPTEPSETATTATATTVTAKHSQSVSAALKAKRLAAIQAKRKMRKDNNEEIIDEENSTTTTTTIIRSATTKKSKFTKKKKKFPKKKKKVEGNSFILVKKDDDDKEDTTDGNDIKNPTTTTTTTKTAPTTTTLPPPAFPPRVRKLPKPTAPKPTSVLSNKLIPPPNRPKPSLVQNSPLPIMKKKIPKPSAPPPNNRPIPRPPNSPSKPKIRPPPTIKKPLLPPRKPAVPPPTGSPLRKSTPIISKVASVAISTPPPLILASKTSIVKQNAGVTPSATVMQSPITSHKVSKSANEVHRRPSLIGRKSPNGSSKTIGRPLSSIPPSPIISNFNRTKSIQLGSSPLAPKSKRVRPPPKKVAPLM